MPGQIVVLGIIDAIGAHIRRSGDHFGVVVGLGDADAKEFQFLPVGRIGYFIAFAFGQRREGKGIVQGQAVVGRRALAGFRNDIAEGDGKRMRVVGIGIIIRKIGITVIIITADPAGRPEFVGGRSAHPDILGAEVGAVLVGIADALNDVHFSVQKKVLHAVHGGV